MQNSADSASDSVRAEEPSMASKPPEAEAATAADPIAAILQATSNAGGDPCDPHDPSSDAAGDATAEASSTQSAPTDPPAHPPSPALSAAEALSLGLSAPQRTAIEKLTTGHTLIESALAAGVNRTTLYRWLKRDLPFAAAYNAWQHDAVATARGRLLALADTAVTAIGKAVERGDGRLALKLLERMRITDAPQPGPSDVEDLEREQALERKRQKVERQKEAERLAWDEMMTLPAPGLDDAEADPELESPEPDDETRVIRRRTRLE